MEGSREQLAQNAKELRQSFEETELELKGVEDALESDSSNAFLLQKYDRLSQKEQQLMSERALWTGAALVAVPLYSPPPFIFFLQGEGME